MGPVAWQPWNNTEKKHGCYWAGMVPVGTEDCQAPAVPDCLRSPHRGDPVRGHTKVSQS